jgi:hypothetical protein
MSSLAARRKQRYRSRIRGGKFILDVEADDDLTLVLIQAGYIDEARALDRREVGRAAARVLADWKEHWRQHGK